MTKAGNSQITRTITLLITIFSLSLPAYAKYSGGTGEPNDPYQIATAEDLILLGETPEDYDKHFILTDDIDLDPNLPGRKVFDKAVIAPDTDDTESRFQGASFTGIFDGNDHSISHLTIAGKDYLGLFGELGSWDAPGGEVSNLGILDVNITCSGSCVGGLVGINSGFVTRCSSTGAIIGSSECVVAPCQQLIGGLVGSNERGALTQCDSAGLVIGAGCVGGLIGGNDEGSVTQCYSTATVRGGDAAGGLLGSSGRGIVTCSYSTGTVTGIDMVGGLIGYTWLGSVTKCYSTGAVGGNDCVGGLVGFNDDHYTGVTACFWDIQTSGQAQSAGGTGKTTAEMQTAKTFLDGGWDFVGETGNGTEDIWKIAEGLGYPRLAWEKYSGGTGEPNDPYQIATGADLIALGETPADYDKHFILTADIDLDPNLPGGKVFDKAVIAPDTDPNDWYGSFQGTPFTGVFDGNDHTISHLTVTGGSCLGVFGCLDSTGEVRNLGVADVNIVSSGDYVGGLAGYSQGNVIQCYSSGMIDARRDVGGLVGRNWGNVAECHSSVTVWGQNNVGGLAGHNGDVLSDCYSTGAVHGREVVGGLVGSNYGSIRSSYSSGSVSGTHTVGGLVGINPGELTNCYSTSTVVGDDSVGGLVGANWTWRPMAGLVTKCYSTGMVVGGKWRVGGLVGSNKFSHSDFGTIEGVVSASFWDTETSGRVTSDGGTGKTTAEMQMAKTFLDAGWDFVGETANGTDDIWWILEGKDYPRLWWEGIEQ